MRLSLSPFHIAHQDFPGCTFCAVCWLWRRPFFLHLIIICCFDLGYWFLLQIEEQSYQIDGGDRRDDTQGDQKGRRSCVALRHDGIVFRLTKSQFTQHQTDALPLLREPISALPLAKSRLRDTCQSVFVYPCSSLFHPPC